MAAAPCQDARDRLQSGVMTKPSPIPADPVAELLALALGDPAPPRSLARLRAAHVLAPADLRPLKALAAGPLPVARRQRLILRARLLHPGSRFLRQLHAMVGRELVSEADIAAAAPDQGWLAIEKLHRLVDRGDMATAESFGRALRRHMPDASEPMVILAGGRFRNGAVTAARRILRIGCFAHPEAPQLWEHQARQELALGACDQAMGLVRRARTILPNDADLAGLEHRVAYGLGHLTRAWSAFAHRWQASDYGGRRRTTTAPPWRGPGDPARRVLAWGEQGVGDEILFAACLPDFVEAVPEPVVECDPRLIPLLARALPDRATVCAHDTATGLDAHLPTGDLPGHFRTRPDSLARHGTPWLRTDPERRRHWRAWLAGLGAPDRPRIGIAWRSSRQNIGVDKSCPLPDLVAALDREPSPILIALQYGNIAEDLAALAPDRRPHQPPGLDIYNDLDGLAALIDGLDRVVTISNVTAHVAGALARPVWLLAPMGAGRHWYWPAGTDPAAWYPHTRLFGQTRPGHWSAPLAAIARNS